MRKVCGTLASYPERAHCWFHFLNEVFSFLMFSWASRRFGSWRWSGGCWWRRTCCRRWIISISSFQCWRRCRYIYWNCWWSTRRSTAQSSWFRCRTYNFRFQSRYFTGFINYRDALIPVLSSSFVALVFDDVDNMLPTFYSLFMLGNLTPFRSSYSALMSNMRWDLQTFFLKLSSE